jgi:hypothetical protein
LRNRRGMRRSFWPRMKLGSLISHIFGVFLTNITNSQSEPSGLEWPQPEFLRQLKHLDQAGSLAKSDISAVRKSHDQFGFKILPVDDGPASKS